MKIKIYPLLKETNGQTRQVISLFVVSRYNNCSTKNLGVITWTELRVSKKQSLCQNFTGIL